MIDFVDHSYYWVQLPVCGKNTFIFPRILFTNCINRLQASSCQRLLHAYYNQKLAVLVSSDVSNHTHCFCVIIYAHFENKWFISWIKEQRSTRICREKLLGDVLILVSCENQSLAMLCLVTSYIHNIYVTIPIPKGCVSSQIKRWDQESTFTESFFPGREKTRRDLRLTHRVIIT